jgi:hypothetical protein
MDDITRKAIIYTLATQKGLNVDWKTGEVTAPSPIPSRA